MWGQWAAWEPVAGVRDGLCRTLSAYKAEVHIEHSFQHPPPHVLRGFLGSLGLLHLSHATPPVPSFSPHPLLSIPRHVPTPSP